MTPKETSAQLRVVAEKHRGEWTPTFGICISNMASDAADAIDACQTTEHALKILTAALKKDRSEGSYYYSWQSSIACAIMDPFPKSEMTHQLANEAAKRFLELLIMQ